MRKQTNLCLLLNYVIRLISILNQLCIKSHVNELHTHQNGFPSKMFVAQNENWILYSKHEQ